jgi:hypothetical protein
MVSLMQQRKDAHMAYGTLISVTLAMLVVFVIDTRNKIRQHSQRK